jgi:23S rRNA pseudouridine2605 synthase
MKKIRLNLFLSQAGIASRRKCDELIFAGHCTCNDVVVSEPGTLIDPDKDRIVVDNKVIKKREKPVIYLFHKPKGYLCSHNGSKTIYSLFPDEARLFSVGRLDKDTSGLLVVTNRGDLAQRLIHPSSNLKKEYLVKTREFITAQHLQTISAGCHVDGKFVKPASVNKVRKGTVKIALKEGKKHEVRIMVASAGLKIISLKRIRLGNLSLGHLPEGAYKEISLEQALKAFDACEDVKTRKAPSSTTKKKR